MPKKHIYYNGCKFCKDENTGYYLSSKVIGRKNRRERLHRYIWECEKGEIPEGYEVHHIDGNQYNNSLDNLELMLSSEHEKLHGRSFKSNPERVKRARENLLKNVMPKAAEWHRSEEGIQWHKEHGKKVWENRKPIGYFCKVCGKYFESLKSYGENVNIFCSNNCKSKWRRMQGYDNIEKICTICGDAYSTNKYLKNQTCSPRCRRRLQLLNKSQLDQ